MLRHYYAKTLLFVHWNENTLIVELGVEGKVEFFSSF